MFGNYQGIYLHSLIGADATLRKNNWCFFFQSLQNPPDSCVLDTGDDVAKEATNEIKSQGRELAFPLYNRIENY